MTSPVSPSTIAALPTAPNRMTDANDPYTVKADATMGALPGMVSDMNTVAGQTYQNAVSASESAAAAAASANTASTAANAAVGASGYMRRSSDSLTIGTGAKNLTGLNSPSAASFANGDQVVIIQASDESVRMRGAVSSANMAAGTMTVTIASANDYSGSGTHSDWLVIHAAFEQLPAATIAEILAGTTNVKAVTPQGLVGAAALQPLTYGTNTAWNVLLGPSARVTLTGNTNFSAPTGLYDGCPLLLEIHQDATGSRTATWDAIFDFGAVGAPTLSTGANKVDFVSGIYSSSTGKCHVAFRKAA